ncbi:uncharacterized protein LOC126336101 [Schistocerca gregaria]|uniref:uncharacterized protein LOC126336101 n=1 Tax=Schistocerca gregaria TaxID=7010 RepID=UPI00211E00E8|nr:uncharacterized protein LOC126336101 [Schistocerca gregaria]
MTYVTALCEEVTLRSEHPVEPTPQLIEEPSDPTEEGMAPTNLQSQTLQAVQKEDDSIPVGREAEVEWPQGAVAVARQQEIQDLPTPEAESTDDQPWQRDVDLPPAAPSDYQQEGTSGCHKELGAELLITSPMDARDYYLSLANALELTYSKIQFFYSQLQSMKEHVRLISTRGYYDMSEIQSNLRANALEHIDWLDYQELRLELACFGINSMLEESDEDEPVVAPSRLAACHRPLKKSFELLALCLCDRRGDENGIADAKDKNREKNTTQLPEDVLTSRKDDELTLSPISATLQPLVRNSDEVGEKVPSDEAGGDAEQVQVSGANRVNDEGGQEGRSGPETDDKAKSPLSGGNEAVDEAPSAATRVAKEDVSDGNSEHSVKVNGSSSSSDETQSRSSSESRRKTIPVDNQPIAGELTEESVLSEVSRLLEQLLMLYCRHMDRVEVVGFDFLELELPVGAPSATVRLAALIQDTLDNMEEELSETQRQLALIAGAARALGECAWPAATGSRTQWPLDMLPQPRRPDLSTPRRKPEGSFWRLCCCFFSYCLRKCR